MATYHVSFPIKGTSTFCVTASSEEEALAAATEKLDAGEYGDVEWEYFEDERTGDTVEVTTDDEAAQSESVDR